MSTAILLPALSSSFTPPSDIGFNVTAVGGVDQGRCIRAQDDGEYLEATAAGVFVQAVFLDEGAIPIGATINSVTLRLKLTGNNFTGTVFTGGHYYMSSYCNDIDAAQEFILLPDFDGVGPFNIPVNTTFDSSTLTTNPLTGSAWTRASLFSSGSELGVDTQRWQLAPNVPDIGGIGFLQLDYVALIVNYSASAAWYFNPSTNHYQYSASDPGDPWIQHNATLSDLAIQPTVGSTLGGD